MKRTAVLVLSAALAVGATSCSDDGDPPPAAPPTSATSAAPPVTTAPPVTPAPSTAAPVDSPPPASVPPFPADTRPDEGVGSEDANERGLALTAVRTARQDGFDRVVFELSGAGRPEWRVEYVEDPRADGSGDPVALRGDSALQVVLRGIGLPDDVGITSPYDTRTRIAARGTSTVLEVAPGAVFEGQQLAFVGLRGSERPFRVFALSDPTRVVVDVRDR